jgi:hypothetical protein
VTPRRCRRLSPPRSAIELLRLGLAEPAASECLHRRVACGLEAMHRIMAVTKGKIDRPYPRLVMVSERVRLRDTAHDLCVRDHFVLGGTSCRLQEYMGRRRDQSSPASRRIAGACGFARHWWPPEIRWLPEMHTTAATSAAKKMAGNNSMAVNRCNVMIAPAPVDHNRMFCADRPFCWQCVQPRWSELGVSNCS